MPTLVVDDWSMGRLCQGVYAGGAGRTGGRLDNYFWIPFGVEIKFGLYGVRTASRVPPGSE